jgi:hypothetical protein
MVHKQGLCRKEVETMINFPFPLKYEGLLIMWATNELLNGCAPSEEKLSFIRVYNIA